MNYILKKLVTIICEANLEDELINELKNIGIKGYTISEARGEGARGVRKGDWDQNRNIRIEVVCGPEKAETIAQNLLDNYYENYAVITFISDVNVLRSGKF